MCCCFVVAQCAVVFLWQAFLLCGFCTRNVFGPAQAALVFLLNFIALASTWFAVVRELHKLVVLDLMRFCAVLGTSKNLCNVLKLLHNFTSTRCLLCLRGSSIYPELRVAVNGVGFLSFCFHCKYVNVT